MGRIIIIIGLVIVVIGILYTYVPDAISWFGSLPGDIKIDKPNTKIFIPITSMIILSVAFSVVMRLIRYLQ